MKPRNTTTTTRPLRSNSHLQEEIEEMEESEIVEVHENVENGVDQIVQNSSQHVQQQDQSQPQVPFVAATAFIHPPCLMDKENLLNG